MSEYLFKVCLLADRDVGKTPLSKYIDPSYVEEYSHVFGVDFLKKEVNTFGILSTHMVWTISSPFWVFNLTKSYLNGANGIILMYDISNANSLNYLSKTLQNIKKPGKMDNFQFLLVGNKSDINQNREVSKEQIKKFKIENNISKSMEISIKTGKNIEKMFTRITTIAFKNITSIPSIPSSPRIIRTPYRREYTHVKLPKSSKRFKSKNDDPLGLILLLAMMSLAKIGNVLIVLIGFIIIILLYFSLRRL
ncbi:MAG: GTP-binding protein [Candidatus Lokiarchaeota archaeon]|nr:GTP-binding protein [Candidatus Lokiarchaeota archaeon]